MFRLNRRRGDGRSVDDNRLLEKVFGRCAGGAGERGNRCAPGGRIRTGDIGWDVFALLEWMGILVAFRHARARRAHRPVPYRDSVGGEQRRPRSTFLSVEAFATEHQQSESIIGRGKDKETH